MKKEVFGQLAEVIINGGAKKATKYISPTETIKATFQGKRDKRQRSMTIIFTVGTPNYEEREFIRKAKKAGQTFPLCNIQIKWPKKGGK